MIANQFAQEAIVAEYEALHENALFRVDANSRLAEDNIVSELDVIEAELRERQYRTQLALERQKLEHLIDLNESENTARQAEIDHAVRQLALSEELLDDLTIRAGRQNIPSSVQSYFDFREQNESFEHVLEYHAMQFTLLGHGLPIRVQTGVTSWNYFDVLGIQPLHGRLFVAGEDDIGAEPLILLSHRFWASQFDSDPDVVGSSLEMNNAIHRVIGILPPIPAFPDDDDNDIWITSASCPFRSSPPVIDNRNLPMIASIFAKLRDHVSIENGASDVNGIAQRLLTTYPDSYSAARGYSADLTALKEVMTGDSSRSGR